MYVCAALSRDTDTDTDTDTYEAYKYMRFAKEAADFKVKVSKKTKKQSVG